MFLVFTNITHSNEQSKDHSSDSSKTPKASSSSLPTGMEGMEADEEEREGGREEEVGEDGGERGEGVRMMEDEGELEAVIEGWIDEEEKERHKYSKKSPPPLIKRSPSDSPISRYPDVMYTCMCGYTCMYVIKLITIFFL